jgi:hypothetical protein
VHARDKLVQLATQWNDNLRQPKTVSSMESSIVSRQSVVNPIYNKTQSHKLFQSNIVAAVFQLA